MAQAAVAQSIDNGHCLVIHVYGQSDHAQPADAIIVLGAGLEADMSPGEALRRRADHAAELWQQNLAPVIICTGGITRQGVPRSEASGCAEVLQSYGIPQSAIILEDHSRSTEENAINVHTIMTEKGWRTAILVSDSYHMLRARWLFDRIGLTVYTSPIPSSRIPFPEYVMAIAREIGAFHWYLIKGLLHLPFTYVPL